MVLDLFLRFLRNFRRLPPCFHGWLPLLRSASSSWLSEAVVIFFGFCVTLLRGACPYRGPKKAQVFLFLRPLSSLLPVFLLSFCASGIRSTLPVSSICQVFSSEFLFGTEMSILSGTGPLFFLSLTVTGSSCSGCFEFPGGFVFFSRRFLFLLRLFRGWFFSQPTVSPFSPSSGSGFFLLVPGFSAWALPVFLVPVQFGSG